MAWGLAGDEHPQRLSASIHGLMLLTWGDFESFSGMKNNVMTLYFEGQLSFEHEEKLTCMEVIVPGLASIGRHELFDDAEFGRFNQVPTVTVGSLWAAPFVVFGGFYADGLCGHSAVRSRVATY
jgi:hypothetical protein